MKKYETPVVELVELNKNDIVTTSGDTVAYWEFGFDSLEDYYAFYEA